MSLAKWSARIPEGAYLAGLRLADAGRSFALRSLPEERWTDPSGTSTVVTYGCTPSVRYFVDVVLGEAQRSSGPRHVPLGSVRLDPDADLTIVRGPRKKLAPLLRDWRDLPDVVRSTIDLPDGLAKPPWENRSMANNLRRIRQNGLRAVFTNDEAELERFLADFYRSFTRARFGEHALPRSDNRIRRWFRGGGLIWIWQQERCLAGSVFSVGGGTAYSRCLATNPAIPEADELGAQAACYLYLCEWAAARGLRRVDLGASRPSLCDGVLKHKQGWGSSLESDPESGTDLFVNWPRWGPGVEKLLVERPLIEREGENWAGRAALPRDVGPDDARVRLTAIATRGLSLLRVHADSGSRFQGSEVRQVPVRWLPLGDGD